MLLLSLLAHACAVTPKSIKDAGLSLHQLKRSGDLECGDADEQASLLALLKVSASLIGSALETKSNETDPSPKSRFVFYVWLL